MQAIAQQFGFLGQLYQQFVDISERDDPRRKQDLVTARRVLQERLQQLEIIVKEALEDMPNAELLRDFSTRLTQLRSSLAYHQGSWPAVLIDEDKEGYRASLDEVQRVFADFLIWGKKSFQ